MCNILVSGLKKRKTAEDANMPPAKWVISEGETPHSHALAEFESRKRNNQGLRNWNDDQLSFRNNVDCMRIRAVEQTRLEKRMQVPQKV